jgi:hypothetical protein
MPGGLREPSTEKLLEQENYDQMNTFTKNFVGSRFILKKERNVARSCWNGSFRGNEAAPTQFISVAYPPLDSHAFILFPPMELQYASIIYAERTHNKASTKICVMLDNCAVELPI